MLKINIITQLLIFFVMAISINFLHLKVLIGLLAFVLVLLAATKNDRFLHAVMRFKWFLFVMLFIYAFSTPGEHVAHWPLSVAPTYEGLVAGATQMLRILLMLAGLSLILANNTRQQLISGFYYLFSPLQYLGLKVERFAARLWLTLHYVEKKKSAENNQDFIGQLKNMALLGPSHIAEHVSVTLTVPNFSWLDIAVIALLFLAICIAKVLA
jgi:energy-coupling factor transporter transmembrane protein EcfT